MSEDTKPHRKPTPPHAHDVREIPIRLLYEAEFRTLPSGRTFTRNRCKVCRCYWDTHDEAFAHQNERERHGGLCPLNPGQPGIPLPIAIAQAEYVYWRELMDDENPDLAMQAMGACAAAANIIGGLIKKRVLAKDEKSIDPKSLRHAIRASQAVLVSGGLQHMLNGVRKQIEGKQSEAVAWRNDAASEAYKDALAAFDEFAATLKSVMTIPPFPAT